MSDVVGCYTADTTDTTDTIDTIDTINTNADSIQKLRKAIAVLKKEGSDLTAAQVYIHTIYLRPSRSLSENTNNLCAHFLNNYIPQL